jgi:hypothetical protein
MCCLFYLPFTFIPSERLEELPIVFPSVALTHQSHSFEATINNLHLTLFVSVRSTTSQRHQPYVPHLPITSSRAVRHHPLNIPGDDTICSTGVQQHNLDLDKTKRHLTQANCRTGERYRSAGVIDNSSDGVNDLRGKPPPAHTAAST